MAGGMGQRRDLGTLAERAVASRTPEADVH